ncbi:hypothetical protein ASPWEDRAFT_181876 [Aspergillus wentii DTO 134E9]|uniref:DUF676 domain-containing protein n=1 Tax=Aspergillus wentii DTO 134E9 TaxID=1073089 RepID=A0A1L9RQ35_ASPWE|nr:uncharacterized protein ASPWEDRAFT_181876 [Aspergillus wentii DTO 134E9]OJJ36927.1 hypothetical protein ASPWEDRAFT_181876 [Aspergillus wentii DTO 134E9]
MSCSWMSLFNCGSPRSKPPKEEIALTPPKTGLKLLSAGADPTLDIVAVHGLGGHRDKSWTTVGGVNWLRDFLPSDLPNARVYAWGHNASNHEKSDQPGGPSMQSISERLILDLWEERELSDAHHRPIIFIAHSLGGTIVKSALLYSDSCQSEPAYHRTIRTSTHGIFFMGTPELDSRMVGLESYLNHHATEPEKQTDSYKEAHWLLTKLREYSLISEDFQTVYAYEMLKTPKLATTESPTTGSPGRVLQVSPRTQKPPINTYTISIDADHSNMIKFETPDDEAYIEIRDYLKRMAQDSQPESDSDSSEGLGEGLGLSFN